MKKYFLLLTVILFFSSASFAQTVAISTSPVAAANIAQGANNNTVYIAKMDVTILPVTVNSIQFTLTGTHDNNDLTVLNIYMNNTAPSLSGAFILANNIPATFAGPHTYSTGFTFAGAQTIAAGNTAYFIITASVNASATSGNTIKVDGAVNPVVFGFTTSPTIINSQTDNAGTQTIQASVVTLTTSPVAVSNISQGSANNVVYIARMDVASLPVTVNSIQFTLTGTHDNNDLTVLNIFMNNTAPSLSGAFILANNIPATFAGPHTYSTGFTFSGQQTVSAGNTAYFIITASVNASATSGNTVKVDGATNPVVFGFTTSPTIINNQTDNAGTQTILASGVTLTTSLVAASNISQGSTNNVVYIARMDVASLPVTVNSIQFTLTGTHDNNDLTVLNIFMNNTAPSLSGAFILANNIPATFAGPHTYSTGFTFSGQQTVSAGSTAYFIITASVNASATSGNTIKVNGAANPVVFGFTTSPTIINSQTDNAGTQTILASGVTLTTFPITASNIVQNSTNNILYIAKMDVTSLPVTVNSIQFTLTGTHDNNDLTILNIYMNNTAPSLSGAFVLANNIPATFAGPHTYSTGFTFSGQQTIAAGGTSYFIVAVNVDAAGTSGNTVKIDGAANPVTFTYTTSPPITNNQTDAAGVQTISGILPLTLLSFNGNTDAKQEVHLQWKTAQEINTKDFEIEWSDDGLQFNKIGIVQAAGNSTQHLHYNYLHKLPVNGNNYYRLKMRDIDGRFTYSAVIKVIVAINAITINTYPNPVVDFLQIHIRAIKSETIVLALHGADGKLIASKQFTVTKGSNRLNWHLQSVQAGNYFISSSNREVAAIQFIKQ
jgi:negative regulator of sigma E activity